ncbi:unnamed protein product [Aphanomyces euteiches]
MFDSLLLLKRGGETVYYGDLGRKSAHLMEYFMRIPGTPEMAPGYNPATWMLEVIGAGVETKVTNTTDYVQVFQNSEEYKQLQAALAVHTVPRADVPEMSYTSKRAATNAIQCQYVVQRFMRMYWRTPSYNYTLILTELGKENVTVKEFTEFLFNMKYDNTVKYTWVVLAIIVLFRLLGLLSLRYINHQKR